MDGKYEVKLMAMPPPREYPIKANFWLPPVHDIGDDVIASRIHVVKKRDDCGVDVGAAE